MKLKPWVAALLGLIATGSVQADGNEGLGFVGGLAWTTGGDDLGTVETVDEDGDTSSESMEAGGEFYFYGGLRYGLAAAPVDFQATFGWHRDGVDAENGEFTFERFPVDLLALYRVGNARIGGGLTYHLSPEHEYELHNVGSVTAEFDNALGLVVNGDYRFGKFFIGARYTWIDYEASKVKWDSSGSGSGSVEADAEFDGNHFGIHGGFIF